MAALNRKRVFLAALAGGVVWNLWSICLNFVFLGQQYEARAPRYNGTLPARP
ncbi:MAG TPA: hypothetical protein VGQ94_01135 [Terriglobales bacterium]|nr:hypothetical protein [Terriglobales bacterium]